MKAVELNRYGYHLAERR